MFQIKNSGWGGGGTRKIHFVKDQMYKEAQVKLGVKVCEIHVSAGLPNTTRPSLTYYQKYNFESEPWWPKFDSLRQKYNIKIVKGDKVLRSRANQKVNQQQQPSPAIHNYINQQPQIQK